MNSVRMIAMLLIMGGVLGLVYGSFRYFMETPKGMPEPFGQLKKTMQNNRLPIWVGLGAIDIGGMLLIT